MEIDQLRNFLAVAEYESFTRAAKQLGLSQPALSRSIQRLEESLGQPVFERQTRKLALTDAGELLKSRAEQILSMIEDTKAEICDDGQSGRIRLGAIPTIAPFFLPELLRSFAKVYPKAVVHVREDTTDNLLKRCDQGEIDIAILALPLSKKYLEIEELFEEELLLVLPNEHPLDEKKRIGVKDIQPYPFVLLDEAHCLSSNITMFCSKRSFHPVSVERTNQLAMVQELVSLNHGISLIPKMARIRDETKRRTYRSLTNPKPTRKIAAIWNSYRFQSRLLKAFQEELRKYVQENYLPAESS